MYKTESYSKNIFILCAMENIRCANKRKESWYNLLKRIENFENICK